MPEGHAEPGACAAPALSTQCRGCSVGLWGRDSAGSLQRGAARCRAWVPRRRGTPALAASLSPGSLRGRAGAAGALPCRVVTRAGVAAAAVLEVVGTAPRVPSWWPWITPEKNSRTFQRRGLPVGVGELGHWCRSLAGVRFMWLAGDVGQATAKSSVFRVRVGLPPRDRWCEVLHRAAEMPFTALCSSRLCGVLWGCPVPSAVCGVAHECPVPSGVRGVPRPVWGVWVPCVCLVLSGVWGGIP